MAYAAASDVSALTRNLIGGASELTFTVATCPTLAQVNVWLTTGCAVINSRLAGIGYDPIPSGTAPYEVAQQANACYAAWFAERSRQNARTSADERARADIFKEDFETLMEILLDMDLSQSGVVQTSRAYAGGISVSDKDTVEEDPDRVQPRFVRGMFANSEANAPVANTSAS